MNKQKKLKETFTVSYIDHEGKKRKFKDSGKLFLTRCLDWVKRGIIKDLKIKKNEATGSKV